MFFVMILSFYVFAALVDPITALTIFLLLVSLEKTLVKLSVFLSCELKSFPSFSDLLKIFSCTVVPYCGLVVASEPICRDD